MITFISGAPGTGKTAALVSLLAELSKTRAVYVSGIPDLAINHVDLDAHFASELVTNPALSLTYVKAGGAPVHTGANLWHEIVPDGAIIVIDEVQRVWRPRGPGSKVPPDIAALETHRHRGLDFYVVSQGPRLMDSNIRALVGRHVHLRDIGFLGRWWYEWPECADNCAVGWKNAPIKKRYTLPKASFDQYKSASVHIKPIRSFPKMFVLAMVALVALVVLSYKVYSGMREKLNPVPLPVPVGSQFRPSSPPSSAQDVKMTPAEYVASFVPRLDGLPQTASRYDEVTKPTTAPYPAACVSMGSRCDCYTQQGTKLPVPLAICSQIVKGGFFMDWSPGGSSAGASTSAPSEPAPSVRLTGGFPDNPALQVAAAAMPSDVEMQKFLRKPKTSTF